MKVRKVGEIAIQEISEALRTMKKVNPGDSYWFIEKQTRQFAGI